MMCSSFIYLLTRYFGNIDMLMQDIRLLVWPMFMGHHFCTILVSEYVFWFANYTKKQGTMC
jgi:hypothetical protein